MRIRSWVSVLAVAAAWIAAPSLAAADGAALYKENCAKCHGDDGQSQTPVGKAMKAPVVAGEHSAADVIKIIREDPKHKSVTGKVSDEDLAAIADYLKTL